MTVHVITTVFCNARVFAAGMQELNDERLAVGARHHVLWQHYPLAWDQPLMSVYADAVGSVDRVSFYDQGRNLGLHDGLQYLVDQINPADDDVVIGFDPDEEPLRAGWMQAMADVMAADPKCGWLSLMSPPAKEYMERNGYDAKHVAGHHLWVPGYSLINTVCAWRGNALKAMGRFNEPHRYYGGFEGAMMPPTMAAGFWIGWLRDYGVAPLHALHDAEYTLYKRHHVGFQQPMFPGSFADWLISRGVK